MKDKVTISNIAELAKVSKTTVSFYLNGHFHKMSEQTRDRIRQAIEATGFQPNAAARSLNAKETRLLGVIIGDITNGFANQLIKGLSDYARQRDYQLILGSSEFCSKYEQKYVQSMYNMGVDGFLIQPTPQFDAMWKEMGIEKPLVYFDSPPLDTDEMYVKTNSYQAVYDAIHLAAERGYTHFVLVTADPDFVVTRQERVNGFLDCLDQLGISYDRIPADRETDVGQLRKTLVELCETHENLCIFAVNNWLLKKVYTALEDYRDRIPEKLGLLGVDAFEWNDMVYPSITTIVQPAEAEGIAAGKLLIDAIEGKRTGETQKILPCQLREQTSTQKPRQQE